MGSVGNTNPWAPYDSYKDCSQGICSVYCPQWCYFLLPPPPPDDESSSDDSTTAFSPLIIAIIGILASAFLLVSYYTIITKYCKRRRNRNNAAAANEMESNRDETPQDQWQVATVGLDESIIKAITVCKYKKGEGLVEDNECSVCLSEFQDDEKLRLLPKCNHAFHLPCIDTWLKCHSNCPLCRANVISPPQQQQQQQQQNSSTNLNINAIQYQRTNDLILVVDAHDERIHREEEAVVVSIVCNDTGERCECSDNRIGNEQFRRSFSLGEFSRRRYLLADTMKMAEDHEVCNSPASNMKRSVSTGRFMNKGKDSVLLC